MEIISGLNLTLLTTAAEAETAATDRYSDWSFWVENVLILFVGFILVSVLISLLRMVTSRADTSVPLQPIFTVLRWVGVLVVLGLVLERFGVGIMTILTTTLAMVAIGFVAVWSLISHVLATFLLMLMKPFKVHDRVSFVGEEVDGRVVDLNLFFTTLRVAENEHIQVPNNMFFQKALRVTQTGDETDLSIQFGRSKPAEDKQTEQV